MPDTKLLQAILNGQAAIRESIDDTRKDIKDVETNLKKQINQLDEKIDKVDKKLTKRLDKIGLQLAYLEDDAPTRKEHDELEKRVTKLEQNICA